MIRDKAGLDRLLGEVHDWVRDVAHPNEDRVAANDEVPPDIVEDMADRGFFGWSIPEEYGGLGLTTEELVMAAMELSQCAVAYRARGRHEYGHRLRGAGGRRHRRAEAEVPATSGAG